MTQPIAGATVRTHDLSEHRIHITSYGDVICFEPSCPCNGPSEIIAKYDRMAGREGGPRLTVGALIRAVADHRDKMIARPRGVCISCKLLAAVAGDIYCQGCREGTNRLAEVGALEADTLG